MLIFSWKQHCYWLYTCILVINDVLLCHDLQIISKRRASNISKPVIRWTASYDLWLKLFHRVKSYSKHAVGSHFYRTQCFINVLLQTSALSFVILIKCEMIFVETQLDLPLYHVTHWKCSSSFVVLMIVMWNCTFHCKCLTVFSQCFPCLDFVWYHVSADSFDWMICDCSGQLQLWAKWLTWIWLIWLLQI